MKRILQLILLLCFSIFSEAQIITGSTGLLNTPSAEMQEDGTFMFGANFLPEEMTPDRFNYDTGNYFLNLSFLPFLDVTYRCTLFKRSWSGKYTGQDRTFGLRAQLIKEKKYMPAIVFGGNDLYSEESDGSNQHLGALYAVATKNIRCNYFSIGISIGHGFKAYNGSQIDGFFGGISISPGKRKAISMIAEYDSNNVNLGASVLLFKHLYLHSFLYDSRYPVGGFAYKIYLKR
ncbi:YjbH domain-containing protein [Marinifilum sp.]|uniref:YjbH domain-containing protein n=1 Tax=Marinifilum sp. TaxID=2033137 RepID=UPI003BAB9B78